MIKASKNRTTKQVKERNMGPRQPMTAEQRRQAEQEFNRIMEGRLTR